MKNRPALGHLIVYFLPNNCGFRVANGSAVEEYIQIFLHQYILWTFHNPWLLWNGKKLACRSSKLSFSTLTYDTANPCFVAQVYGGPQSTRGNIGQGHMLRIHLMPLFNMTTHMGSNTLYCSNNTWFACHRREVAPCILEGLLKKESGQVRR